MATIKDKNKKPVTTEKVKPANNVVKEDEKKNLEPQKEAPNLDKSNLETTEKMQGDLTTEKQVEVEVLEVTETKAETELEEEEVDDYSVDWLDENGEIKDLTKIVWNPNLVKFGPNATLISVMKTGTINPTKLNVQTPLSRVAMIRTTPHRLAYKVSETETIPFQAVQKKDGSSIKGYLNRSLFKKLKDNYKDNHTAMTLAMQYKRDLAGIK